MRNAAAYFCRCARQPLILTVTIAHYHEWKRPLTLDRNERQVICNDHINVRVLDFRCRAERERAEGRSFLEWLNLRNRSGAKLHIGKLLVSICSSLRNATGQLDVVNRKRIII